MKPAALAVALAALTPAAARAGEVACWYERGVVVAPASIAGLAGDYILDTGAPLTQLHETKAQAAGLTEPRQRGAVRVAGVTLPDRAFQVADLDARTYAFDTPIAGVIGADILSAYVVDVSFSPCRVSLHPARRAPRFTAQAIVPLQGRNGPAVARAAVSDGPTAMAGSFVISTGADAAVRVGQDHALVPGAAKIEDLLPGGDRRAGLRAASFAGQLFENLDGGLALPADADGVIGAPLLAHWRLRFDFPRRRLLLAPAG